MSRKLLRMGRARAEAQSRLLWCGAGGAAGHEGLSTVARVALAALCAGLLVAVVGCARGRAEVELQVGGARFHVEVAATSEQRTRGLMYRTKLGEREGMLFVFEDEQERSFWMRNTPLPLTIAYIDSRGVILHIADMEPYSEAPVRSLLPARYALEVNRGALARAGVSEGDLVQLPANLR